jgi:hypothetical protein
MSPVPDLVVTNPGARTALARAVRLARTAHAATADPVELARALRIVRVALATGALSRTDLTPLHLSGLIGPRRGGGRAR